VKRSKGEMNIQSKCNENENSIIHLKSSVKEIKQLFGLFPYKRSWKVAKVFKLRVLNCVRGSEVCSVPEKRQSKKMHGFGDP
jgi:hypothetical protein